MNTALLVLAMTAGAALAVEVGRADEAPAVVPLARPTKCAPCHDLQSWSSRRFAHERTAFPLRGRHADLACRSCHDGSNERRQATGCHTCHDDVHVGQFGARCDRCHDAESWRPTDPAEAHRRTNFPLLGRHALLPCQECHGDRRDRGYARPTVACIGCHQRDYAGAGARSIDHVASQLPDDCRRCHATWSFGRGILPQHEDCFQLEAPPHAGIRCADCHTRVAGLVATGACFTGNAACTRCHGCGSLAPKHSAVAGYQCRDRKCYECHRLRLR